MTDPTITPMPHTAESTAQAERWKRLRTALPYIAILVTNIIPIWGVLFGGWDAFALIFIYLLENVIAYLFFTLYYIYSLVNEPLSNVAMVGQVACSAIFIYSIILELEGWLNETILSDFLGFRGVGWHELLAWLHGHQVTPPILLSTVFATIIGLLLSKYMKFHRPSKAVEAVEKHKALILYARFVLFSFYLAVASMIGAALHANEFIVTAILIMIGKIIMDVAGHWVSTLSDNAQTEEGKDTKKRKSSRKKTTT